MSPVEEELLEYVLKIEMTVAAGYRGHKDIDDIVQVARIAGWRASLSVDVSRGGWRSYIRMRMESAVLQWLRDYGQVIRVPRHAYERGVRVPVANLDGVDDLPAR